MSLYQRILPATLIALSLAGCVSERERKLESDVATLQNEVRTLHTQLAEQTTAHDQLQTIVETRINTPEVMNAIAAVESNVLNNMNTRLQGREAALDVQVQALARKAREADVQMTRMEASKRMLEDAFDPKEYDTLKGTIAGIQSGALTFRENEYYPFRRDQLRHDTMEYLLDKNTSLYNRAHACALVDLNREATQIRTEFKDTYMTESANFDQGSTEQNGQICDDIRNRLNQRLHELQQSKETQLTATATRAQELLQQFSERLLATSASELADFRKQYDEAITEIYSPTPPESRK